MEEFKKIIQDKYDLEYFSVLHEKKQLFAKQFVKQNSTVEIVDLICDGEITVQLIVEFFQPTRYSQKDIDFKEKLQIKIKGSDIFDGVVADMSKLFTKALLDYCEQNFTLKAFR